MPARLDKLNHAIIGMRYGATELMGGVTEVLAYGTAVVAEPIERLARARASSNTHRRLKLSPQQLQCPFAFGAAVVGASAGTELIQYHKSKETQWQNRGAA
jgi:hypothetical protein